MRLFVFDVLAIGQADMTSKPYTERRRALDELAGASTSDVLVVPRWWQGVDPLDMLATAASNRVEGIVSKHIDSKYVSGRSRHRVKTPV